LVVFLIRIDPNAGNSLDVENVMATAVTAPCDRETGRSA
jgi:hypothetical protein